MPDTAILPDVIGADDPRDHPLTDTPPHHHHLLSGTPTSPPAEKQRRRRARLAQPTAAVHRTGDVPPRALYPIPEVRQLLGGMSHSAFYERVREGQITLVRLGRRSYVAQATIDRITSGQ